VSAPILACTTFGLPVVIDGASEGLTDLGVVKSGEAWRIGAVRTNRRELIFTGWEPGVPVLYLSQALNAILLVPLLIVLNRLSGDRKLMGEHANGAVVTALAWMATLVLLACVLALAVVSLT